MFFKFCIKFGIFYIAGMGRPKALLNLVLFGLIRPKNRPTGRAWTVRQARWPMEAWPDGMRAIQARALSGRA